VETPVSVPLFNREISDLAFIRRVLDEASNAGHPVLERLKFLAISGILLDEFYRLRVTGLREQIRAGVAERSPDGLEPREQLLRADRASNSLLAAQERCWQRLTRDLHTAGIAIASGDDLDHREHDWLRRHFQLQIGPRLAPIIVEPSGAVPFIEDGAIVLLAELEGPRPNARRKALVPLPAGAPRFVALPGRGFRFVTLESVLAMFLEDLFAGCAVGDSGFARIVREGNLKLSGDADDLLGLVREALNRRQRADVIRLEVQSTMPEGLRRYLAEALGLITSEELKRIGAANEPVTTSEFIAADRLLGLADAMQLVDAVGREAAPSLRFSGVAPSRPEFVAQFGGDFFAAITAKDRLLHFPYDDFGVFLDFLRQAAQDPDVSSIAQTLYRTGRDSPVVEALARAARLGKQVTAVVELEAREDEFENIELANRLNAAGATVLFGFHDKKVHVKALWIVRRENGRSKGYVNFSTGNYHPRAARQYTDLSLLSANPQLVDDAAKLFAYLAGGPAPAQLSRIALAPLGLRERLVQLIEREAAHAAAGRPAAIWLKLNKLSDPELIEALYRASRHGVDIRIVARGVCCLKPGIEGLSDSVRVKSIVGRFLEHSRIACFGNGHGLPSASADVFLSSADWMTHKIDRRVEALVPVDDADAKRYVQDVAMAAYLRDAGQSWQLRADGIWVREAAAGFCAQSALIR
jgi:polyphosphate kinase